MDVFLILTRRKGFIRGVSTLSHAVFEPRLRVGDATAWQGERGTTGTHKSGAVSRRSALYGGGRRAERRVCNFSPLSYAALFPPTLQHARRSVTLARTAGYRVRALSRDHRSSSNPPAAARASIATTSARSEDFTGVITGTLIEGPSHPEPINPSPVLLLLLIHKRSIVVLR